MCSAKLSVGLIHKRRGLSNNVHTGLSDIKLQATAAPPVKGKMFKGLCLCYTVVVTTFFSVAVSGYWAFGNQAESNILSNFIVGDTTLVPKWFLVMTNVFTLLQLAAVGVVCNGMNRVDQVSSC